MGTSLIASLDTHRSISRYVASLLAQKSHSSCREQNASLITWSSSFFLLTQTSMASLGAGIPAPLVRYHTIVICKGNHIKPLATRSPTQRLPSVKNLIKIPNYSFNKNSHILENGLVPPCSILLGFYLRPHETS